MDCFVAEFIIGPAKRPDPLAPRNDESGWAGPALHLPILFQIVTHRHICGVDFLSLRTGPERIAAESLTPPGNRFRSPQHLALPPLARH